MHKVLIVTDAVNEKNGANGSMINLYRAISDKFQVNFVVTKRNKLYANVESIFNLFIFSSIFTDLDGLHEGGYPRLIFCIGSISPAHVKQLRVLFQLSKIVVFHTGDIKRCHAEEEKFIYADYVLFQSVGHLYDFRRSYPSQCHKGEVLYPTVNEFKFHKKGKSYKAPDCSERVKKISIIGSIQDRKNQIEAVRIIHQLINKFDHDLYLDIIGPFVDSSYREALRKEISSLNLEERVQLYGFKSKYYEMLRSSDVLLSVSREEGLSTVIREAMFLRKLVIATDIRGNYGTLSEENSIVISLNNSPEINARVISDVLISKEEVNHRVEALYSLFAARHGQDSYRNNLFNFIESINV